MTVLPQRCPSPPCLSLGFKHLLFSGKLRWIEPGLGVTQILACCVEFHALGRPVRATTGPWGCPGPTPSSQRGLLLGPPGAKYHREMMDGGHSCAAKPLQKERGPLQGYQVSALLLLLKATPRHTPRHREQDRATVPGPWREPLAPSFTRPSVSCSLHQ